VHSRFDAIVEQWARERPDLDTSAMALLGRIERLAEALEERFRPTLERFGLSGADFDVLCALRRAGKPYRLTPTELTRQTMVSAAGTTKRVVRLERRGLVARRPDPGDRRSSAVGLTAAGRRLIDRAVTAHVADEQRAVAMLTASQRRLLAELLDRLAVP
jgi:DNA-binding MarR family transcriptional regulator